MSRPLAPTLTAYPRTEGRGRTGEHALAALESFSMAGLASCHPATVERGLREVRALLAVARAAREVVLGYGKEPAEILLEPEHLSSPQFRSMCRALDKLARVSGPATRKGKR